MKVRIEMDADAWAALANFVRSRGMDTSVGGIRPARLYSPREADGRAQDWPTASMVSVPGKKATSTDFGAW